MDKSFEEIRWKLAEDMTDDDVAVLLENKDKLNPEEKAAFENIITEHTPLSDDPLADALANTVDEPEDKPEVDVKPAQTEPQAPQLPENVVTQDKLDTYLEDKRKEWELEGKTKAEQKAEEQKIQQFFEAGYTPKDWNDYTNTMIEKVAPLLEQRILAKLDAKNAEASKAQDQMRQTQEEIFKRFEGEFSTLAKSSLIPDPKTDPEGYKSAHDQIIAIGDAHGKTTVTDAYKLWSVIPKTHGGGLDINVPVVDEKKRIEAQKERAGKIGKGTGGAAPLKGKTADYNTVHKMSLDDLIEARLQQG